MAESDAIPGSLKMRVSRLRCPGVRAATAILCLIPHLGFAADLPAPASSEGCGTPFRVAIDVGHTLSQPGATSASGITEFQYNRRLAEAVSAALARVGIATVLIGLEGTPLRLEDRTKRAGAAGASLFLSLHHDSVQPQYLSNWTTGGQVHAYSDVFHGYSVFVSGRGGQPSESLRFALLLGSSVRDAGFTPSLHHAEPIPGEGRPLVDRRLGVYRFDQLVVLRTASMPAALLEAAIIVNRQEEEQVRSGAFLDRMAAAVTRSVQRFCSRPREREAR
jgi:N-acetylmuramoyl-L-alanine amidase